MSDRDDLAELIADYPADTEKRDAADAVIAAGWRPPARKIQTVAELDELQPADALLESGKGERNDLAAVIRDNRGNVFARDMHNLEEEVAHGRPAGWWETGTGRDDRDSTTMTFPVTVLLVPAAEVNCGG
ncbi:hypothetical protein ACFWBG_07880 [Nocardia salmonicida]|uniref:hypothetical protein n=1 Tax=Nocardia salmonicida TaxID=53431 RepID=UPI00366F0EF1